MRRIALLLAALTLCAACAIQPGPAEAAQPMLYPVLSKAAPNTRGIPDYPATDFVVNSFKLVNETWEDVTEYINGSCKYIYVNGAVYGVQISEYEPGETYVRDSGERHYMGVMSHQILGLDGKPIEALEGLVHYQPWYCRASAPKDLMYVASAENPNDVGAFHTRTGKLAVPAEYVYLLLLEDCALGIQGDALSKLDYDGNVLWTRKGAWYFDSYDEGDELLRVNWTTYIDRDGEVALVLDGMQGITNFKGAYAAALLGGGSIDVQRVFIDRQGRRVGSKTYSDIVRFGDYYLVNGGAEVLDLSLRSVFTLDEDHAFVNSIVGGQDIKVITHQYGDATEPGQSKVFAGGNELLSAEGYLMYENGYFIHRHWNDGLYNIYDSGCRLIFENARVQMVSGDGKYIYVDDGKHMGYIDAQGNWVYRINAAYYNLED
jgi:hypothetical protein